MVDRDCGWRTSTAELPDDGEASHDSDSDSDTRRPALTVPSVPSCVAAGSGLPGGLIALSRPQPFVPHPPVMSPAQRAQRVAAIAAASHKRSFQQLYPPPQPQSPSAGPSPSKVHKTHASVSAPVPQRTMCGTSGSLVSYPLAPHPQPPSLPHSYPNARPLVRKFNINAATRKDLRTIPGTHAHSAHRWSSVVFDL